MNIRDTQLHQRISPVTMGVRDSGMEVMGNPLWLTVAPSRAARCDDDLACSLESPLSQLWTWEAERCFLVLLRSILVLHCRYCFFGIGGGV